MSSWFVTGADLAKCTEYDCRFSDTAGRSKALVQQLSLETDAILFDMRSAHDDVFALTANRQVIDAVRTQLFTRLGKALMPALESAGLVVFRRIQKRGAAATDAVVVRPANAAPAPAAASEALYEPVTVESDLIGVIYPPGDGDTITDLIASIPSRARGYSLAGAIRTYLSGYRAPMATDPGADGAGARPWETSANELLTTESIVADAKTIAGTMYCAAYSAADVPQTWVVCQLVYNSWNVPPFVAGPVDRAFSHVIKAPYQNGPQLTVRFDPAKPDEWRLESSDGTADLETIIRHDPAAGTWGCFHRRIAPAESFARGTVYTGASATEWDMRPGVVRFNAVKINSEHMHAEGNYVKNATIDCIMPDRKIRWAYENGTRNGARTFTCGTVAETGASSDGCAHITDTEAAVPRLIRLAAAKDHTAQKRLRDEIASAAPFSSTIVDPTEYNQFKTVIEAHVRAAIAGTDTFTLHACHAPTSGANSGRDDVPVIRMGQGNYWCTGQHALAATTGMLVASCFACR